MHKADTAHTTYFLSLYRCLYVFTAGRYEYINKGVDLFLDSLGELNKKLKAEKSKQTVIAFIIMPARVSTLCARACACVVCSVVVLCMENAGVG